MAQNEGGNGKSTVATDKPAYGFDIPGAVGAAGRYFTGLGQGQDNKNQQKANAQTNLANFYGSQRNQNSDLAYRASGLVGPENTVQPYAKLALQRALIGGLNNNSTVNAPAETGYSNVTLPVDYEALKGVANQYLSDGVLADSAHQQQSNIAGVNPNQHSMNLSNMFGEELGMQPTQDIHNQRQRDQQLSQTSMNSERDALMQALAAVSKDPSLLQKILGGLGSIVTGGLTRGLK